MQRYRSGHNEAVLKTVCPKGRVGSNPTLCVRKTTNQSSVVFLCQKSERHFGEIPKWLKGLPWKGSRSLIAVRGFKSLFLRSSRSIDQILRWDIDRQRQCESKNVEKLKKQLTSAGENVNIGKRSIAWQMRNNEKRRKIPNQRKLRKYKRKDLKKDEKSCWQRIKDVII